VAEILAQPLPVALESGGYRRRISRKLGQKP
jgi:hypothetical protein